MADIGCRTTPGMHVLSQHLVGRLLADMDPFADRKWPCAPPPAERVRPTTVAAQGARPHTATAGPLFQDDTYNGDTHDGTGLSTWHGDNVDQLTHPRRTGTAITPIPPRG
jgi:hypothetical protein